jgi:phosphonate transport system substrate-binding protein
MKRAMAGVGVVLLGLALACLPACSRSDDGKDSGLNVATSPPAEATNAGAAADTTDTASKNGAEHSVPSADTSMDRADWPAELRLGIIPVEGGADVMQRFRPLIDHLAEQLGRPVHARSASSYNGVIIAMANQQIDIAYFGPKSYVEASRRANAEAVAMELSETGEPGYYSIIIARADAGIETLAEAAGKQFAFTDPNSTSGCLVPRVLLQRDENIRPESFFASPVKFSGSHGNSIIQVKNGHLDVAATNTLDLARAIQSGTVRREDFVILWKSEMIPGSPMTIRRDLPPSLKDAYREALLAFNEQAAGLEQMANQGYTPANDEAYDVVRYLMRKEREMDSGSDANG